MKIRAISLFTAISICCLSPKALAISNPGSSSNNESSFLQQIQNGFSSFRNYVQQLSTEFSSGWGELSGDVKKSIDQTVGDLGIPDLIKSGKNIEASVAKGKSSISTTDPGMQGVNARHDWDEQYTKGQSQAILGADGQRAMNQENQISQAAVDTSSTNADTAQSDIVTQDVMKKIAIQNAQQANISRSIQQEAQQQTKTLAAANVNLSDINSRMDEQQKKQQIEESASSTQTLKNASFNDGFWSTNNSTKN